MLPPLVLGYHAVSATSAWAFSVTPEQLERQVRSLLGRGLRAVTFADLCRSGARDAFAVTFDDGYRSVRELAAPVLARLGVPSTVFAVPAYADAGAVADAPAGEGAALSWDELRDLAAAEWEIGSHTLTHPVLTELDDASLAEELRGSKERLERELGRPCDTVAYPYGAHDARVVAAAAAAGYGWACVFPPTYAARGPHAVPRVGVLRRDGRVRFALKTTPLVRRALARRRR